MFALSRAFSSHAQHPAKRAGLMTRIVRAQELNAQRRALSRLDPHLRRDVGLSDREVEDELMRSMWDAPENWRR